MKKTELRIGNLVLRENQDYSTEITLISGFDLWHAEQEDDIRHMVEWRSLKPITLTEEWLEKLGFHKYDYLRGYPWKTGAQTPRSRVKIRVNDNKQICVSGIGHIEYVHELQNIYFALVGFELKTNI